MKPQGGTADHEEMVPIQAQAGGANGGQEDNIYDELYEVPEGNAIEEARPVRAAADARESIPSYYVGGNLH